MFANISVAANFQKRHPNYIKIISWRNSHFSIQGQNKQQISNKHGSNILETCQR